MKKEKGFFFNEANTGGANTLKSLMQLEGSREYCPVVGMFLIR